MTERTGSRLMVTITLAIVGFVDGVDFLVALRAGLWPAAVACAIGMVAAAAGWFFVAWADALLSEKRRRYAADAAIQELALATMRRAIESGHDIDLSIPVGRFH